MRMLTKEWYQTMLDSGLGVMLRPDERAAEPSEALFQEIWEEQLSDWLQMRKELCPELDQVYDEAEERRYFEDRYLRELEELRTRTPKHILDQAADLRFLALGICTKAVFEAMKEYRARCREWTEKTMEEAWNLRRAQGLDRAWTGEHSLHDSFVLRMDREGEDLRIEFEREDPMDRLRDVRENDPELLEELGERAFLFPEIKAVRFRGARILKQEQPVENAWWLYDEIWQTEEGYEIHALLWREPEDGVFELTIACRDTELVWTIPPEGE